MANLAVTLGIMPEALTLPAHPLRSSSWSSETRVGAIFCESSPSATAQPLPHSVGMQSRMLTPLKVRGSCISSPHSMTELRTI